MHWNISKKLRNSAGTVPSTTNGTYTTHRKTYTALPRPFANTETDTIAHFELYIPYYLLTFYPERQYKYYSSSSYSGSSKDATCPKLLTPISLSMASSRGEDVRLMSPTASLEPEREEEEAAGGWGGGRVEEPAAPAERTEALFAV
jgi:hypothetical protein